jgi:peptide/nickel transport system permease protein
MRISAIVAALVLFVAAGGSLLIGAYQTDAALRIDEIHWQGSPMPPCFQDAPHCGGHILGTDENGRDMLARLLSGTRSTFGVALTALFIEFAIAVTLAGFSRLAGRIGAGIVTAAAEGVNALPRLPLILMIAAIMLSKMTIAQHPSTFEIGAWLAVLFWPRATLLLRERFAPVGVLRRALSDLMTIILLGAMLDFLGFGVQPPTPSWGNMLANAQENLEVAWWACIFPGACIFVTVLLLDIVRRGLPAVTDPEFADPVKPLQEALP